MSNDIESLKVQHTISEKLKELLVKVGDQLTLKTYPGNLENIKKLLNLQCRLTRMSLEERNVKRCKYKHLHTIFKLTPLAI